MTTFTWAPDTGLKRSSKPRVMSAKYGDGYVQDVADGINNSPKIHNLSFSLLLLAEYQAILSFLETAGGVTAFTWTPPNGVAGRFVCRTWDDIADTNFSITATFEQVYGR